MFRSKKSQQFLAVLVILTFVFTGVNTAVQAPRVETDRIVTGQKEAVQGVSRKGYVEVPEGEDWEALSLVLTAPDGTPVTVEAELDENSGHFLFEEALDDTGVWTLNELQIEEDGQTVVQPVEDTVFEVFETAEEAFDASGPQILADSLDGADVLTAEEYATALANVSAVDAEGEFIPLQVEVSGAVSQDYEFFNDGQERTASEPIDTAGNGPVNVLLTAEGAEPVAYEFHLDGDAVVAEESAAEPVQESAEAVPVVLNAQVQRGMLTMTVSEESDAQAVRILAEEAEDPVTEPAPAPSPEENAKALADTPNLPPPEVSMVARLGGTTIYETATAISGSVLTATDTAILVNRAAFPDALAAASLTRAYNAPILYTEKTTIPEATLLELERLGVKTVYLIGGEAVISADVQSQLARNYTIQRIWGTHLADTARAIATHLQADYKSGTALVANGSAGADGLVAGAYASRTASPIFYTTKDTADAATLEALRGFDRVIIVGGAAVVSDAVEQQIAATGVTVERAWGQTLYDTSVEFAKRYFPNADRAVIASGRAQNLVDGLVGSFLGGTKAAPVILTARDKLPESVIGYYNSKDTYVSYLLGGPNAVSEDVFKELLVWTATPYTGITNPQDPDPEPVRIMLDPGHGWNFNQGVDRSYYEGNQMLYFADYLRVELQAYGFEVGITRMPDGLYAGPYEALLAEQDYAARIRYGSINNQIYSLDNRGFSADGYDLMLSLHSNAPYDVSGSELYDSVTSPNKVLADKLLAEIASTFGHRNRGVKYQYNDDGITNWYNVLRASLSRHAFLIEHGFHSNWADVGKLQNHDFLKTLAQNEARVLAEHYGLR